MTVSLRTSSQAGTNVTPERGEWVTQAKCRNGDPDALFVRGAEQRKAAVICRHCPVLDECRADALDNRVEFGVWGGLTERQRRALLRKNPHVTSWADYLAEGGELNGI
ncbi:WhiB family transcriptional regulator [Corynebacterium sp. L4756]|uniref:WhiB family transcriptional regulator n=1 Tax=unclassified Corynebacterium TaxID=2624378 RepID=UPI00374D2DA8